jgi:hypothetical protein
MALFLFILPSPILGVNVLTIPKTISQVARMLETWKVVGKLNEVHTILIKEYGEVDVVNTILIS